MLRWALRSPDTEHPTPDAPPTDGEALLDQIAAQVVRRGLVTPAVFFIELNRPLSFLAGQATHTLFPFLAPLFGVETIRRVARLLDDPASVDRLLERIERLALRKDTAPNQHGGTETRRGRERNGEEHGGTA